MSRTFPLLLLAVLAACSETPDLLGPEEVPTEPVIQSLDRGDAIQDAIERILPALPDRGFAGELTAALRNADADRGSVEALLARLGEDEDYAADAEAIRLALVR